MLNKATLRARWKAAHDTKANTAAHMAARCIIRALLAKHPDKLLIATELLYQAFTPITNSNKLLNGSQPFGGLKAALARLLEDGPVMLLPDDGNQIQEDFMKLVWKLWNQKWEDKKYVLIVLRSDLSPPQWAVQAAHVALELARWHPDKWRGQAPHIRVFAAPSKASIESALALVDEHLPFDMVAIWRDTAGGEVTKLDGSSEPALTAFALPPMRDSELRRRVMPWLSGWSLLHHQN